MSYSRADYTLFRYELVAPGVRNDGSESNYREAIRSALPNVGFNGWTEIETTGYWCGKLEAGTTFVIYAYELTNGVATEKVLSRICRRFMPDQEAIQIVKFPHHVELIEA